MDENMFIPMFDWRGHLARLIWESRKDHRKHRRVSTTHDLSWNHKIFGHHRYWLIRFVDGEARGITAYTDALYAHNIDPEAFENLDSNFSSQKWANDLILYR